MYKAPPEAVPCAASRVAITWNPHGLKGVTVKVFKRAKRYTIYFFKRNKNLQ